MARNKLIIYTLLTVLTSMVGLNCGYFLLNGKLSESVTLSVTFDFHGFGNLIGIVLIEFIFGFSVISLPICLTAVMYRSLVYGCSMYFIFNTVNRVEITIFYTIVYLLTLTVYICTSMFAVLYSKTLSAAVPDMSEIIKLNSTHKYIKRFIICSAILLLSHVIKIVYLYVFY